MPSQELIRAATAQETAACLLTLLTISVDNNPVLHLVDNLTDVESNGTTYTACSFTCLLPDQAEGGSKTCKLQIDNTDTRIYGTIKESLKGAKEIRAEVAVIMSTSPDVYEQGPLSFILRNVSANAQSVSAELYDGYMADRKFTAMTYSPDHFPGLFF